MKELRVIGIILLLATTLGCSRESKTVLQQSKLTTLSAVEVTWLATGDPKDGRRNVRSVDKVILQGITTRLDGLAAKPLTTGVRPSRGGPLWIVKLIDTKGEWISLSLEDGELDLTMPFNIGYYGSAQEEPKIKGLMDYIATIGGIQEKGTEDSEPAHTGDGHTRAR